MSAATATSHKERINGRFLLELQHTSGQKFHNAVLQALVVLPRIGKI